MKNLTYFVYVMAICAFSLTSCSKENLEEVDSANLTTKLAPVNYSSIELDVLELVNAYRSQQGLPELLYLDESSVEAAGHNDHMIENNEVCHDFFGSRYEALVKSVSAKSVSENVASGFRTAEAVVNAWIKSDGHRKNMEGEHTHFGISVKEGKDGELYYTNIFVKK
jgi:uncharacterized protein YkwD